MSQDKGSRSPHLVTVEKLESDDAKQQVLTPNLATVNFAEDEFNEDYENALQISNMTRMKSKYNARIMDAVEQERALMVE